MRALKIRLSLLLLVLPICLIAGQKDYSQFDKKAALEKLSPLQYEVTQKEGTENAFKNEYWDNKQEGIYVDLISGEPLFSSTTKYDSKTGWPSFWEPINKNYLTYREDTNLFWQKRIEVRSKHGNSHLGHVFKDGPPPTGLRYCINSAALKFIPKEDMAKLGYGDYLGLFEKSEQTKSLPKDESKQ